MNDETIDAVPEQSETIEVVAEEPKLVQPDALSALIAGDDALAREESELCALYDEEEYSDGPHISEATWAAVADLRAMAWARYGMSLEDALELLGAQGEPPLQ